MPKSYRIRTEVGIDKYINVNLEQDWESLEILSLKILSNDIYTRFCADYGIVTGRVFVNNGFGLPNAKVSVFIPLEPTDELDPVITELYPFKTISDTTEEGYRYNLLPKLPSYNGHTSTGSFPNKGDVLMDGSYIEVFNKYYRFTVTTNDSGDFMIFGVPVGTQTIVMDIDLSDIGCFSLSPQDLIQQGLATETQVNGARFKSSTNLRELPQIKNLVFDVDVRPFWGDADLCQIGITRVDFDLTKQANINIQPTSIFMGSIISTTDDDALKVGCKPKNNTGNLCELVSGPGEISAIRQTIFSDNNGLPILEKYEIEEGGKVIDGDGTYLLNVPMNMDYVFTNEFGQQIISNDPKKGIPTTGKYRFKFRWQNEQGLQSSFLKADFLVPNVKEYGWTSSGTDPFTNNQSSVYNYPTIPIGQTSGTTVPFFNSFGLAVLDTINVESYQILINGQPYTGTLNSIPILVGDTLQIIATPVDSTQVQNISFTQYPQPLFELYKSYAFTTDWDDYVNVTEAINCEDTFYAFGYNKVYTTAMFLDRYKNGIGRARHLGIKEIDNRTCKSNTNTFPVNDIIRNFDFIFFVFNILINILTFPILTLLFVAHLIALLWPIIKVLLLFLGPYLIYQGFSAGVDLGYYVASLFNLTGLGIPVISISTILQIIAQGLKVLFLVAAGIWFTIWYTKFFVDSLNDGKVDNFPRIGLPMIAYPDCTSCDCDCGVAVLDDDITTSDIQSEIDELEEGGASADLVLSQPKGIIAPFNSAGSYSNLNHPNLSLDGNGDDPFPCTFPFPNFKTLSTLLGNDDISQDVVVRAVLDFKRMASGYDVISSTDPFKYISDESYLLKAPQPFLFSADKIGLAADYRFFGYPISVPLAQKLNEFNTRDKYFNAYNSPNQITTWVNPSLNIVGPTFKDQVLVVIMNLGTASSIGAGGVVTFQDPNTNNGQIVSRTINLTGATTNQFNNNSITGTTLTGNSISVSTSYADPNAPNGSIPVSFLINSPQVSGKNVIGNPLVEQSFLQYPTDVEYFQLITGMTITQFTSIADTTSNLLFPSSYLLHDLKYIIPDCSFIPSIQTVPNVITTMASYGGFEVCVFVRGVDPFTAPQTIRYDLSKIFGYSTSNANAIVEGTYYLNIPIQAQTTLLKPAEHDTITNLNNLYFPSYTFTIDPSPTNYTGFTSNLPYYYLSTDDSISSSYTPLLGLFQTNAASTLAGNLEQTNPDSYSLPLFPAQSTFVVGGSYMRWNSPFASTFTLQTGNNGSTPSCDQNCQKKQYYNVTYGYFPNQLGSPSVSALYSPAYYRQLTTQVNFSNPSRIVMRSDRLPTSTSVQNGTDSDTGYGLHQNDNFLYYGLDGVQSPPSITAGGDLPNGDSYDEDPTTFALTETLACEGMVPLECYSGSGSNVGVKPYGQCNTCCKIPENRMINGCYCLLNKKYVKEYGLDVRLFLEWKVRFTMNFAACRGVFAQTFQNNWINGVLYMFSFNKRTTLGLLQEPTYNYCKDVIVFNELRNIFFYRSSPWNGVTQKFIGKNSPTISPLIPASLANDFPGTGYNKKQIQFPTTVVDLGPRDSFINEICCSAGENGFGSYYSDQIKSTSYQDNSDIVQLGFLSRILNEGVRQRILPISTGGNNSEGKGIVQFFNSTRGGYRIDGDWSQMLSINSEWKVLPFITENIPSSQYIYFGDNQNGIPNSIQPDDIKPIMGLFFTASTPEIRYRKIMSPGIETYNFSPLLEQKFGYPKSQNVPHYKWLIKKPTTSFGTPNIFGSEDNNWFTEVYSEASGNGFFSKKYQDLDFISPQEKYQTSLTQVGYIASFNLTGGTMPITNPIAQCAPSPYLGQNPLQEMISKDGIVVGAPYHFYFGLNNGKTAINRFYKLYVPTVE